MTTLPESDNSPTNIVEKEDSLPFLHEYVAAAELNLNQTQFGLFSAYKKELLDWNTRMNLTGIKDDRGIELKHFADSISLGSLISSQKKIHTIIDIGTGAGFPGIPLAILFPEKLIYLVESIGKKVNFLEHVVKTLNLQNVQIVHDRAEEFIKYALDSSKEKIKWSETVIIARAVASFEILYTTIAPAFEQRETNIMFQKSTNAAEEEIKLFIEKKKADNNYTAASHTFDVVSINNYGFDELKDRSVIVAHS